MRAIALLLVVVGVVGLVFGGIGYSRQKTVFDFGGVRATATEHRTLPIAPILGIVALVGGVALLVAEKRKA